MGEKKSLEAGLIHDRDTLHKEQRSLTSVGKDAPISGAA